MNLFGQVCFQRLSETVWWVFPAMQGRITKGHVLQFESGDINFSKQAISKNNNHTKQLWIIISIIKGITKMLLQKVRNRSLLQAVGFNNSEHQGQAKAFVSSVQMLCHLIVRQTENMELVPLLQIRKHVLKERFAYQRSQLVNDSTGI